MSLIILNSTFNNYTAEEDLEKQGLPFNITLYNLKPNLHRFNSQSILGWGPKRDPLYVVIPITLIYILIFVSGVLGNVSTCIVIFRNKSMHTATNYYLFSLAVSDLLLLISGLPPEIYSIWYKYPYIFGEAFCVLQGFAAETSANATVLTITAFTVERYVAICHPFLSHTMSKLSRAIKFIIFIWAVAMCLATPQAMSFGIYHERLADGTPVEDHYVCAVTRVVIPHAFEISTCVFFATPMTLIVILYILIGLQLHKSTAGASRGASVRLKHRICKPTVTYMNSPKQPVVVIDAEAGETFQQRKSAEEDGRKNYSRNAQATKHVITMLIAVVVAFFICWAPFHAQRLLAIYGRPTSKHMVTAFGIMTYISGVLYYLSTSINPLLYHIISNKFREAFKETFKRFFRRGRGTPSGKCYSTLSGRSSQVNSHSNTDSCSRQSSLRYLEAEMAKLHESQRPLVVSFKRKKPQITKCPKQVTILRNSLNESYENSKNSSIAKESIYGKDTELTNNLSHCGLDDESFAEVNILRPTHVCPLNESFPLLIQSYPRLEDIEIFQEQHLKINCNRALKGKLNSHLGCELYYESKDTIPITKSCTMPQVGCNNVTFCHSNDDKSACFDDSVWLVDNNLIDGTNFEDTEKYEKSKSCTSIKGMVEDKGYITSRKNTVHMYYLRARK